jgi:NAD(P)-dependent dehydrogenase (short-subunit alcohol dehydrogenase family)
MIVTREAQSAMPDLSRRRLLQLSALLTLTPRVQACAWAVAADAGSARFADAPASPNAFNARSTAEQVTAGLDLAGKTMLVTGATSGLGYETLRVLALRGAHVLATGRTLDKAQAACDRVTGDTTPLALDLADFESVVACAEAVNARGGALDALICNAGIMALPELEQVRGIEKQFVVNHLGHFLLVNRLLEPLLAAEQGRVVVVSSRAHRSAPAEGIQFENLSGEQGYEPMTAYAQSKLANGLFAFELSRRLAATPATSNALHPGVIITNIVRHLPGWQQAGAKFIARWFVKSLAQGAATQCFLAAHPSVAQATGEYFEDCQPAEPSAQMRDAAMAARLWEVSEELTRGYLA